MLQSDQNETGRVCKGELKMVIAGIVAGGIGSRMGGEKPKQFMELCGVPILIRTVRSFLKCKSVDHVIVGITPSWVGYMKDLCKEYDCGSVYITPGGEDRNGTVENIISFARNELGAADDTIILTHDAVRPFVSDRMIVESISALSSCEICTAAVPATDTMIISHSGKTADEFPLRSTMFNVQTPQSFRIGSFMDIMSSMSAEERAAATDVCRLYRQKGYEVRLVDGEVCNIKLTYPSDMIFAQGIVEKLENTVE